jgi:hypothetical protein
MKNKRGLWFSFMPLVITISLYVVFYSRIECQPNHAGFWLIFAMGAATGVTITKFLQKKQEQKAD